MVYIEKKIIWWFFKSFVIVLICVSEKREKKSPNSKTAKHFFIMHIARWFGEKIRDFKLVNKFA